MLHVQHYEKSVSAVFKWLIRVNPALSYSFFRFLFFLCHPPHQKQFLSSHLQFVIRVLPSLVDYDCSKLIIFYGLGCFHVMSVSFEMKNIETAL